MKKIINTADSTETEKVGQAIGEQLKGGEVIELTSDLGGGKTTFVRGLARGVGSTDSVNSPSFTIENVYAAGDLEIRHFDFYRLQEAGIAGFGLEEVLGDDSKVVILEWAGIAEARLPADRLIISFLPNKDESRTLTITAPKKLEYLLGGL